MVNSGPSGATWALALTLSCQLLYNTKAQTMYPPCDVPRNTMPGVPKCEAVYPSTVRWKGGEKVIVALSNLHIPWYAKSQYDPCPWSHKEWRQLNKIGTAGHTDPLAFPVMSLISMTAGRISVGMYEDTPIKVWNRTLDKLDFRDYIYIEPERNNELLQFHKDHVMISFTVPAGAASAGTFDMYIDFEGKYTKLSDLKNPACQIYMYDEPKLSDVYPEMASVQGGTTISLIGSFYIGWPRQPSIAKFVDAHGQELVVPQKFLHERRIEYVAPPYVLNETDLSVNMTIFISFSWQTWFEVLLNRDTTIPIVYYDESRVTCGQTVMLESILGHVAAPQYDITRPHKVLSVSKYMQHFDHKRQTVAIIDKTPADHNSFWTIKEAHGEKPCTPGRPILCNQTIRLTSLTTGLNLHSGWADSPSDSQRGRLVSARGYAGHEDAADDWLIRCEPNTIHPYDQSLYNRIVGQSDTGEVTAVNYTWSQFTYNMALHKARFKWILEQNNKYWRHSTGFSLLHVSTERYLSFEETAFSNPSCDQDPQTAITHKHKTGEQYGGPIGIECNKGHQHLVTTVKHTYNQGEPTDRTNIRFYLSSAMDMPIDCGRGAGGFRTRYGQLSRRIAETDFVVWQNNSANACDNQGSIVAGWHCENCNYIVGQVHQVSHDANTLVVEVWAPRFPMINSFMQSQVPQYQQTLERRNITLLMKRVQGPLVHKMDGNSRGPHYPRPADAGADYWSNSRMNIYNQISDYFIEYRQYVRLRLERAFEHSDSYHESDFGDPFDVRI